MPDTTHNQTCLNDDIAAYLDGELDAPANARFEAHVGMCNLCAGRLREQRALLCELDFMLEQDPALALPDNFTELITVRAQADMRGARDPAEHWRAVRWCGLLGATALVLLGGAWRETVWQPLRQFLQLCGAVLEFAGNALYDAGAGLAFLSRNVSSFLLFRSAWLSWLATAGAMLALIWLLRLINNYHRTHSSD
jgi:hypothetical protein